MRHSQWNRAARSGSPILHCKNQGCGRVTSGTLHKSM